MIQLEEQPAFFARVEDISADRKPDWYKVRLLILQLPLTEVAWLLREEYINGEPFTINGLRLRMEKVEAVGETLREKAVSENPGQAGAERAADNVVSLFDRKRG